jgi:hypothetical protein
MRAQTCIQSPVSLLASFIFCQCAAALHPSTCLRLCLQVHFHFTQAAPLLRHYTTFPKAVGQLVSASLFDEVELSLTQGRWVGGQPAEHGMPSCKLTHTGQQCCWRATAAVACWLACGGRWRWCTPGIRSVLQTNAKLAHTTAYWCCYCDREQQLQQQEQLTLLAS